MAITSENESASPLVAAACEFERCCCSEQARMISVGKRLRSVDDRSSYRILLSQFAGAVGMIRRTGRSRPACRARVRSAHNW